MIVKSNKIRSLSHYCRRIRELGLIGSLRRFWMRVKYLFVQWSQSIWWGFIAHRKMSDASLLKHTIGNWTTVDALLEHLAERPAFSFLLPHESPRETSQFLYNNYPEHISAVLNAADASCRNEVNLLGQIFTYPNGIDWQCEPVTKLRWPQWHRSRIGQYLYSSTRSADLILFWELNRHQHFITLGIAYWLTGEQRYVDSFISQIQSWIEKNPRQHGLNWYFPLEISIRILAWTVSFQFFRQAPQFREKIGNSFLKSLWQQADFLSGHLQTTRNDIPNNHMIAELVGLALVGSVFPEYRNAAEWRDTGFRLLTQQAIAQTFPDGVNREQATGYHRFVAELLLLIVARIRKGALPREPILENTLEGMLDYMLFSLTPIGTTPMWGDSDYGRALGLGQNKNFWDHRPILSAGAVLFGRPEWKYAAGRLDEEAFWLLGEAGWRTWEQLEAHKPGQTSRAFPYSGLYIIRDAWTADSDFAFFRCGPFGLGGDEHCAHAHCDLLSFELWVSGQALLEDSGTYIYSGPWRNQFRLTAAHNTVMVDSYEQAIPLSYFNWRQVPEAKCFAWTGKRVIGSMTYSGPVILTREIIHDRPGIWEVNDKFTGVGEHTLEWFFHFAVNLDLRIQEGEQLVTVLRGGNPFLALHIPDLGVSCHLRAGWYSDKYGIKQPNRVLYGRWQGKLEDNGKSFRWEFRVLN
jgi:hypothetical protein